MAMGIEPSTAVRYSTDEILKNFDESAVQAESYHDGQTVRWFIATVVIFLGGLAASLFPNPVPAVALLLLSLHFSMLSNVHRTLILIGRQHRAMAQLVGSLANGSEARHVAGRNSGAAVGMAEDDVSESTGRT